jgi:acetyltransferase-like isoleucine patch superfamily enzyme
MNKLKRILRHDLPLHLSLMITNILPDNIPFLKFRGLLVSFFIKESGKNLQVGRNVTFYNPCKLVVGDDVYIAQGCWFSMKEEIIIGSKVLFGPYVIAVTANHSLKNDNYYDGDTTDEKSIHIDYGCWIGGHSTILPGSKIKRGTLIASNSVVRGETEEFGIYAGSPIKLIKYAK